MTDANQAAQAAMVVLGKDYTQTFDVASKRDPSLTGSITIALPDGRDVLKMGLIQHRLREGVPLEGLDLWTQAMVRMLSMLAVVVTQAPDWWYAIVRDEKTHKELNRTPAPEQIKDLDLLWEIHGRYVAFRDSFPGSGADSDGGRATGGAGAVADRQAV